MTDKFQPDLPTGSSLERKEFSFEEGVAESVKRIKNLFENSSQNILVRIHGSDTDVGKSYLLFTLQTRLGEINISTQHTDLGISNPKRKVVIFNSSPYFEDATVAEVTFQKGRHNHLHIAIYRPDRKFLPDDIVSKRADIIIRNEGAKDKS